MDFKLKKMRTFFIFLFGLICVFSGKAQNISVKIVNYNQKLENHSYATYIYVNSSYSLSRPFIILVVEKNLFVKYENKILDVFKKKQEYTDVYLIGIEKIDFNNLKEIDKTILASSLDDFKKFRAYFKLPKEDDEIFNSSIVYLKSDSDFRKIFGS